ncbi:MAG: hypothetical protein A3G93_08915 [Nitrospinae bacterium RIFCSPLOWO2_12_FULL_45_22]|nr:MAG: hypothetical protein A3G93_08915 [Nitrospinae bacterium RIFCSPLOWO2_12_FULL_45_22]
MKKKRIIILILVIVMLGGRVSSAYANPYLLLAPILFVKTMLSVFGLIGTTKEVVNFIASNPPGIDVPLMREDIVSAPVDHVWEMLLSYVQRCGYDVHVAAKQSGALSFGFSISPDGDYTMSLYPDSSDVWTEWEGWEVEYNAKLYVTVFVNPIGPGRTKVSVCSLARVLGKYKNDVYNIGWRGSSGRIEREVLNAARGS